MTDEILRKIDGELEQIHKTGYFCNKCGYHGGKEKHDHCNYLAGLSWSLQYVKAIRVAVEGFKETIIMSEKDSKYQDDAVNRVLKMRAKEIAAILGVKDQ